MDKYIVLIYRDRKIHKFNNLWVPMICGPDKVFFFKSDHFSIFF